jgi:hypothetical protein
MALTGNLTRYIASEDHDNLITESVTYPAELEENDFNYDKRGTTEDIVTPSIIETPETLENIYLIVTSAAYWRNYTINSNNWELNFNYLVYNSQEERNEDLGSFILEDGHIGEVASIEDTPNDAAYAYIKTLRGFESLTDI